MSVRPPRKIQDLEKNPKPTMQLVRLYEGRTRNALMGMWSAELRSGRYRKGSTAGWLHDPTINVGASSHRHQGTFSPYGVLCHALGCPQQMEMTRHGLRTAFGDLPQPIYKGDPPAPEVVFCADRLPPVLYRFLVPMDKRALTPDYEHMAMTSGGVLKRLARETRMEPDALMQCWPTISTLHECGASFNVIALIIDANLFHEDKYVPEFATSRTR